MNRHFPWMTALFLLVTQALGHSEQFFQQDGTDAIGGQPNTEYGFQLPNATEPPNLDELEAGSEYNFCPEKGAILGAIPPITQVNASIRLRAGRAPEDCSEHVFESQRPATARTPNMLAYHWQPTNFFHNPLYFDDTPLERYGQSRCPSIQSLISGVRFFGTLPILPYKMGIDRPHDCVSTLGYYRPGACTPCIRERFPAWEKDAALLEAGTALVLVFALP